MSARARILVAALEQEFRFQEEREQKALNKLHVARTPRQRRRAAKQYGRVAG